jgi:hypothetical protein
MGAAARGRIRAGAHSLCSTRIRDACACAHAARIAPPRKRVRDHADRARTDGWRARQHVSVGESRAWTPALRGPVKQSSSEVGSRRTSSLLRGNGRLPSPAQCGRWQIRDPVEQTRFRRAHALWAGGAPARSQPGEPTPFPRPPGAVPGLCHSDLCPRTLWRMLNCGTCHPVGRGQTLHYFRASAASKRSMHMGERGAARQPARQHPIRSRNLAAGMALR